MPWPVPIFLLNMDSVHLVTQFHVTMKANMFLMRTCNFEAKMSLFLVMVES
jgi:hypothetical protein